MKGVHITGRRQCEIIDRPVPRVRDNYVLIKVHVAPTCNEYNAYKGGVYIFDETPLRLGHQVAGEVVAVGNSHKVSVGDRVISDMSWTSCGRCTYCRGGHLLYCHRTSDVAAAQEDEADLSGFAQYTIRGDWSLTPIPESLSYAHAGLAICGCGPSFSALNGMSVGSHSSVLITGLGPVGLGGVITATARGARVIGVGRSSYRRQLATQLGADVVIDPTSEDALSAILEATGGVGTDAALECSAQVDYVRLAIDATRPMGQINCLGECGEITIDVMDDLILKGRSLHGRTDTTPSETERLLGVLGRNVDKLDTYITHKFSLDDIKDAWEVQMTRQCGKVLIYPWD